MKAEPLRLVYVEDNEDNFVLTKRVLESTGRYELLWAPDGAIGLELVRSELPVLVLLDLDIPKLTGFELAEVLRADSQTRDIPLVAVSANVMNRERKRALDAGCDAFVEKPIDIMLLRATVDELIAARRTDR